MLGQAIAIYFHKDSQFDFELVRTMGQASYGGAEIGECLATAARIFEGDYDSWYAQWSDTAGWLYARSDEAEKNGHLISARDGFLRCANYFRTAEFFLHDDPSDPRIRDTSTRGVKSFHRAAALFDPPIEVVEIPYEGIDLPGYFYPAQTREPGPHPTILVHNGFDGSAEEIFSFSGRAGQERGYNILAFGGPGQGQVIRHHGLVFRPDWEAVIGPVIDYLETRPDVDTTRIGLIGISMGGVLAPRAAAFEPRLAAVAAWDGVYDMQAVPLDFVLPNTPTTRKPSSVTEHRRHHTLDPDTVILEFSVEGTAVQTGSDYHMGYISVITVSRNGIQHYRDYWNSLAVAVSLGGVEPLMTEFGRPRDA
jgi:hypothetical protein